MEYCNNPNKVSPQPEYYPGNNSNQNPHKRFVPFFSHKYHHYLGNPFTASERTEFIKRTLRRSDIACRFGGEELLFIFPKTTTDEVKKIALKLQKKLISLTINYQGDTTLPPITLSMGIVTFSENMKNQDDLLKVADKALYSAKHHGRNQIRIFEKGRFMKV